MCATCKKVRQEFKTGDDPKPYLDEVALRMRQGNKASHFDGILALLTDSLTESDLKHREDQERAYREQVRLLSEE